MKINVRRVLFISGLCAVLVAIAIYCLIIGRGHTVYFDNSNIAGTNYNAYESIDVKYDGKKAGTLASGDRCSVTLTGQKLDVQFIYKKDANSSPVTIDSTIALPYSIDGIAINVPAYLEGAQEDIYISEYVSANESVEEVDEEVPVTDEFGISVEDE